MNTRARKLLKPSDKVTAEGRILAQRYARIFPKSADRMYYFRKSLGLSQKTLAEDCELSSSTIGNLERGYGLPKGQSLIKIAKGVGISPNYLLALSTKKEIEP